MAGDGNLHVKAQGSLRAYLLQTSTPRADFTPAVAVCATWPLRHCARNVARLHLCPLCPIHRHPLPLHAPDVSDKP